MGQNNKSEMKARIISQIPRSTSFDFCAFRLFPISHWTATTCICLRRESTGPLRYLPRGKCNSDTKYNVLESRQFLFLCTRAPWQLFVRVTGCSGPPMGSSFLSIPPTLPCPLYGPTSTQVWEIEAARTGGTFWGITFHNDGKSLRPSCSLVFPSNGLRQVSNNASPLKPALDLREKFKSRHLTPFYQQY